MELLASFRKLGGGKIGMVQDVEDFPSELHVESL
jgi:hypothetical protein